MGFLDNTNAAGKHPVGDFIGIVYRAERFNRQKGGVSFALGYKSEDGQVDEMFTIVDDNGQLASKMQRSFLMARLLGAFGIPEDAQRQALANANTPDEVVNTLIQLAQPFVGRKVRYQVRANKEGYHNVRGGEDGVVPVLLTEDTAGVDPWATPSPTDQAHAMAGAMTGAPDSAASVLAGLDLDI